MAHESADSRSVAGQLFERGVSRAEVARRLRVSRATTTRWFRIWRAGGQSALTRAKATGRPPKLDPTDLEGVQTVLLGSPSRAGLASEQWSLAAITALIERSTGVTYHPRHVARVLRRSGWVVPPVGPDAPHAFRRIERADPDGNAMFLIQRPDRD